MLDVINILAIIIAPIASVLIGKELQDRAKRRQDKMDIFKTLMTSRVYGWTTASVYALNIIDIVFADDKQVRSQWKIYYDKLCVSNPSEEDMKKIETEKFNLLEVMAVSLGYKDKITWETIQKPYIPQGLTDAMLQQQQYQNGQVEIMNIIMKSILPTQNGVNSNETH